MTEIWKDIPGYEGLYQASSFGNIRSLNWRKQNIVRNLYLKPHNKGYLQVELSKGGKKKMITVHRLVALAFIPNPDNLPVINHKDENKNNNNVENLEWCTFSYNTAYSKDKHPEKFRYINQKRCKHVPYKYKQKVEQVDILNGTVIKVWNDIVTIKNECNYNNSSISECCSGKRKTAYGFKWRFAN